MIPTLFSLCIVCFLINFLSLKYGDIGIVDAYNGFVAVFHTKGNMQLLAETFQRKLVLTDFRKWFLNNIQFFINKKIIENVETIKSIGTD